MEITYGERHCETTIQHLQFASVIGRSWISPCSLISIGIVDHLHEHTVAFLKRRNVNATRPIAFAKWLQLQYFPEMYNHHKPTPDRTGDVKMLNRKMKVYHQYCPVKNSSQYFDTRFHDFNSEKSLATITTLLINVDPVSRRPIPYPNYWKNHFTPDKCVPLVPIDGRMPRLNQAIYAIPDNAVVFTLTSRVEVKQIDYYGHVHSTEYFNFCLDAIGAAFIRSVFGNFGSVFNYNLKRVSFLWLNELLALEEVKTVCWHGNENPFNFKFHIMNRNGVACQVEFEFFPDDRLQFTR